MAKADELSSKAPKTPTQISMEFLSDPEGSFLLRDCHSQVFNSDFDGPELFGYFFSAEKVTRESAPKGAPKQV